MRLLALLLVPAFIGLVRSQQGHGQGRNFPDQGRAAGGASRNKPLNTYPDSPAMTGMTNMGAHGNVGTHVNAGTAPRGGSSRQLIPDYAPVAPGPFGNNVNHVQSGNAPPQGGSSRQTGVPYNPFAVNHLTQQEAGKAEHVSGAASVGSTIAGVVIAVLVVVGIVAVAAVFLVRQRQSRMTIASV